MSRRTKEIFIICIAFLSLILVFRFVRKLMLPDTKKIVENWRESNGNWYYYQKGAKVKSTWMEMSIVDENGNIQENIRKYFNEKGENIPLLFSNENGTYLAQSGPYTSYYKGLTNINGQNLFFDLETGLMKSGWIEIDGVYRYFDKNTYAESLGWTKIDNYWYYLTEKGRYENIDIEIEGETYQFGPNGISLDRSEKFSSPTVKEVLDFYKDQNISIVYHNLNTNAFEAINEDMSIFGASVPKIILLAYVQDRIERGLLSWDDKFTYVPEVADTFEAYMNEGTGTIQFEDYYTTPYTVRELSLRVARDSDNIGSNMLLHFVGNENKEDFDKFVKKISGLDRYSTQVNAISMHSVMRYLYLEKETLAKEFLNSTIFDRTMLDVLPVNVIQKVGSSWPYVNNSTGVIEYKNPFVLTIMTAHKESSEIEQIVEQIYEAVLIDNEN